ncbi:MAK10-like protein [Tanacetum coccineum]
MGDENPIRTLGDYFKPSQEGYRNTIELPKGNNVVPLRSDTIRLVQNGCSFHGLRSQDPNQHLKFFLKLVDSLDLDVENRERTRLRLFQFSLRDQASNWTAKLRNDILMFQQHHGESLSEAWTRFEDLLQNVPHHGIDLWIQVQIFYEHVNPITRRTIDQSAGGKLHDRNAKESWALLEDLALYDNESWNDPRDFAKPVKAIALPQDVLCTSDCRLTELENQVQRLMEAHLALVTTLLKIVKDVEVHIGKLKLLNDFYVIDMKKDPKNPLLVGRGFLATANAVIDCRMAKIAVEEGITRKNFLNYHLPGEWEIDRDVELNPFKDTLVFRRMVEFLGAIPINLKSNMWELEDLIKNPINWDKSPKNGDGAWHAKIRLIDPDGEEFTKTLHSIPTTRKLFEREIPRDIIDLDHF